MSAWRSLNGRSHYDGASRIKKKIKEQYAQIIIRLSVFAIQKNASVKLAFFYGRDDWIDVVSLRRFVVARALQALTGILPSASPPCRPASSPVRNLTFHNYKNIRDLTSRPLIFSWSG